MGHAPILVYPGIVINGIKILREIEPSICSGNSHRRVEYECSECHNPIPANLGNITSGKMSGKCRPCTQPPIVVNPGEIYGDKEILKEVDPRITPKGEKYRVVRWKCSRGHIGETDIREVVRKPKKCQQCILEDAKYRDCPEYHCWLEMRYRCIRPSHQAYKNYGARGITVCDRWMDSFENFFEDMGSRPSPMHSLDRINNDGNYEPSNCKWATKEEQNRNKRTNRWFEYKGERGTLTDWSRKAGVSKQVISYWLKKYNNDHIRAFSHLGL